MTRFQVLPFEGNDVKKILILEDNNSVVNSIERMIQKIPVKSSVFSFNNLKDAYQCALEKDIHLFIVDIILGINKPGDASGLKFIEAIRQIEKYYFIPVIIITSLEDSKLYTYEKLHCYSFIEKPFDAMRLQELVEKCVQFPHQAKENKTLYFRKDGVIFAVGREDIVYAETVNHVMHIYTAQKDLMKIPYITLKRLMEDADSPDLIQCSRQTVVNKAFIHNVDIPNRMIHLKKNYGDIEIGIRYKKSLKEMFC